MNFLQRIHPAWLLRIGFGVMYLYSGYDLMANPQHWYGFVPQWFSRAVTKVIPIETYLALQGAGEFIIGLLFLAWFFGKWPLRIASLLAIGEMTLILLVIGVDPITFRDIGLLGGTLTLFIFSLHKNGRD